jgi:hypothetical protein
MGTGNEDTTKQKRRAKQPEPPPEPETDDEAEEERPRRKGARPLFQDEVVTVSKTRMIIRDASGENITYAMANVTSVQMFVEPKNAVVAFLAAALLILGVLFVKLDNESLFPAGVAMAVASIVFAVVYLFVMKPKFWVRIGTAGAETDSVYSLDQAWTKEVVAAVNEAIISRG